MWKFLKLNFTDCKSEEVIIWEPGVYLKIVTDDAAKAIWTIRSNHKNSLHKIMHTDSSMIASNSVKILWDWHKSITEAKGFL